MTPFEAFRLKKRFEAVIGELQKKYKQLHMVYNGVLDERDRLRKKLENTLAELSRLKKLVSILLWVISLYFILKLL